MDRGKLIALPQTIFQTDRTGLKGVSTMNKNYTRLERHQGIYKNTQTKRYLAVKKIYGVQYSESFDKVREAIHWRRTFNGTIQTPAKEVHKPKPKPKPIDKKITPTLLQVWELIRKFHFPTLEKPSVVINEKRFCFLQKLHHFHLEELSPSVIDKWLREEKEQAIALDKTNRCSFEKEIKLLTMIFSWYRNDPEFGDYKFVSPILKRHRKSCVIKKPPVINRKITPEDAFKFINLMLPPYQDLALFQYLTASRIGEAAGTQIGNINLDTKELIIKDCCVWAGTAKHFSHLKPYPKNGEIRYCHINDLLEKVIKRRLAQRMEESDYLFHENGKPLEYRRIQWAYIKAQKMADIPHRSTHCLRYGMATLTRRLTRSLDATMAMTSHKDIKLADHYSEIGREVQKETSLTVERHLKQLLAKSAVLGCTGSIPTPKK